MRAWIRNAKTTSTLRILKRVARGKKGAKWCWYLGRKRRLHRAADTDWADWNMGNFLS